MKKQTIRTAVYAVYLSAALMLSVSINGAQAAESDAIEATLSQREAIVEQLSITNPTENYGVKVGDQLTRHIRFSAPAPYALTKSSLPKKGSEFKGIELVEVTIEEEVKDQTTNYKLALVYQVFVNPGVPSGMQLPKLAIALTGGEASPVVSVPSWPFWFAPLVVGNNDNAMKVLQADIRPPLLDANTHQNRLIGLLVLAGLSLMALLYMNADGRWLPFMGGAFAQAHRQLKKLAKGAQSKTQKEEKQALVYIHQAFNSHYGANIFARDIDHFITIRPTFAKMKAEISEFFDYSNKSLYATEPRDSAKIIQNLVHLSKALRDCERGV
jgi:mxaA protein